MARDRKRARQRREREARDRRRNAQRGSAREPVGGGAEAVSGRAAADAAAAVSSRLPAGVSRGRGGSTLYARGAPALAEDSLADANALEPLAQPEGRGNGHDGDVAMLDGDALGGEVLGEEPQAVAAEGPGADESAVSAIADAEVEPAEPEGRRRGFASSLPGRTAAPARAERAREHSLLERTVAFLRASWAELQRMQWPDRRLTSQATAVVLGFVIIAGVYLGVADWVAQRIVNLIL
jgi:preprotein translocase subunit SecE